MRITNAMISSTYLRNLNTNLTTLDKYSSQLATGKRITKLSDDPVGVLGSMQARVKLSRLAQYQSNVGTAQDWMTETETSLTELNKILKTAYERTLEASSDTLNDSDRHAIAEEIGQLRDHVLNVANSKISNKYIFGGYNTSTSPFKLDEATGKLFYNGLDVSTETPALLAEKEQNISFEIGYDMTMEISMNGLELLGSGDSNIYNILDELYNALESGSSGKSISPYIEQVQSAQEDVLSRLAEVGGKTNRLDLIENRYAEDEINYAEIKSKVEDTDQAEAIMQYKMAESVYLLALQVGSNIIQPTLVDYLN